MAVERAAEDGHSLDVLEGEPEIGRAVTGGGDEGAVDLDHGGRIPARTLEEGLAHEEPAGRHVDGSRLVGGAGCGPCTEEWPGRVGPAVGLRAVVCDVVGCHCCRGEDRKQYEKVAL